MKILVTGAKGFVGKNLCVQLNNIKDGKARCYGELKISDVFEYDLDSTSEQLDNWCKEADFVFNLAGVNRPKDNDEFMKGNFGFANMGLFESVAKFLSLISKDEALHVAITQRIIKNWSKGKDGKEWKEIWYDNKNKVRDMYIDGLHEETKWTKYLFQYGTPIVGLNAKVLDDYNEYMSAKRMKNIGLKFDTKITKDPLPWIQLKYANQKSVANAPQETKVVAYLKDPINKLDDLSKLKSLF